MSEIERQMWEDPEFKTILSYIVSWRPAWATGDPVSKNLLSNSENSRVSPGLSMWSVILAGKKKKMLV